MQRMFRVLAFVVVLALIVAPFTPAQAGSVVGGCSITTVTGTLTDDATKAPIANGRIWIGYVYTNRGNVANVTNVTTDATGQYKAPLNVCASSVNITLRAFVLGYPSTVIYSGELTNGRSYVKSAALTPQAGGTIRWAGLRESSYGPFAFKENPPDAPNPYKLTLDPWFPWFAPDGMQYDPYYPPAEQWVDGMQWVISGTVAAPATIWEVGKIIFDKNDPFYTDHQGGIWFQFEGTNKGHMRFSTDSGKPFPGYLDQYEMVTNLCNLNPKIEIYLAVEPGYYADRAETDAYSMEELIKVVMGKFKGISCVKGFAVDAEWYQTKTGDASGTPVTKELAAKWEKLLIQVTRDSSKRLMLKHFKNANLTNEFKDTSIIWVNSSQQSATKDAYIAVTTAWANRYVKDSTFADVGYQFGYYGRDEDGNILDFNWWWPIATKNGKPWEAIWTIRDDIAKANTNSGQGIVAFWVDMTLWFALPYSFPSPEGGSGWAPNVDYGAGDEVSYRGRSYVCLQAHTSQTGWEPSNTPALWQALGNSTSAWQPNVAYAVGATVLYNGSTYKCLQAHTSQVGWEPSHVPSLWQKQP